MLFLYIGFKWHLKGAEKSQVKTVMESERKGILEAAAKAGKKARALAKRCHYEFVKMEDGCLYKMVNGKKKLLKKIPKYVNIKEQIQNDERIGW